MLSAFEQGGVFIVPHLTPAFTRSFGFAGLIRRTTSVWFNTPGNKF
jgi:hypothetical protein